MCTLREGKIVESQEKKTQNEATKPNCTRVRVAGLGKELRMVFVEVFVKALDKYQMKQRIYGSVSKTGTVDGGVTDNQSGGNRRFERIRDLVDVGIDAPFSGPYCSKGIPQALLSGVSSAASRPGRAGHSVVSPWLPAVARQRSKVFALRIRIGAIEILHG
jgi:hypothetical protein